MERYAKRIPYLFGKKLSCDSPEFYHISDPWIFAHTLRAQTKQFPHSSVIKKAIRIAFREHKDQHRREGVPYIVHPLRAAVSLVEKEMQAGYPVSAYHVATIVLHDTLEDSATNQRKKRTIFTQHSLAQELNKTNKFLGDAIAQDVLSLTKDGKDDDAHFISLSGKNRNVRRAKIFDRRDNLFSLPKESLHDQKFAHERRRRREVQIAETQKYILPLAYNEHLAEIVTEAIAHVESDTKQHDVPAAA